MTLRLLNHQVNIKRQASGATQRLDDGQADTDVRDEPAVHDVDMQPVAATGFGLGYLLAKPSEISRQDRSRDTDQHPLVPFVPLIPSPPDPLGPLDCTPTRADRTSEGKTVIVGRHPFRKRVA
jgi:hypothetical protein